MATDTVEMLVPAPTGRSRQVRNIAIVLFILYQVLVPLRYYLGGTEVDERFTWRMFSSVGMRCCNVSVYEITEQNGRDMERRLPLKTILQLYWANQFRGYHQPDLIKRFLQLRCQQVAIREVRFERNCSATDGSPVSPYRVVMNCQSGLVRSLGPVP